MLHSDEVKDLICMREAKLVLYVTQTELAFFLAVLSGSLLKWKTTITVRFRDSCEEESKAEAVSQTAASTTSCLKQDAQQSIPM